MNTNENNKSLFLETAWNIGCQLMNEAIRHDGACTWQGYWIEPLNGKYQPVMRAFGPDVYSGTSGIALFLNALFQETKDHLVFRTLEEALSQVRSLMHHHLDFGYYSGKAGIASVLCQAGLDCDRDDWFRDGLNLLLTIPNEPVNAHDTDVISGAAGTIPVLLNAYHLSREQALLEKAVSLGSFLLKHAQADGDALSWATVPAKRHLTGFSHGAAGIALALLQLGLVLNEDAYLLAAQAGFRYERQVFDPVQQNWPDFREDVQPQGQQQTVCGMAWCHGAPGVAISRAKANELIADAELKEEGKVALITSAKSLYGQLTEGLVNANFSLCHGAAGNADIIMRAGGEEYRSLAEAVGVAGIHMYAKQGKNWPGGLNGGHKTPGLMMGMAGTGYFYLRLFNPQRHATALLPEIHSERIRQGEQYRPSAQSAWSAESQGVAIT